MSHDSDTTHRAGSVSRSASGGVAKGVRPAGEGRRANYGCDEEPEAVEATARGPAGEGPEDRPAGVPHPPTPDAVERLMEAYPRIFFACHQRHVRDPEGGGEVSAHQASILSHLDGVDPTRVSALAEHMGVTTSTMSLSIKRLERDGYVRRDPDPDDGRAVHLRLTAAGERVRRAQSVLEPRRVEALLEELEPERREEGLRGLEILARAAEALVRTSRGGPRTEERGR